MAAFLARSPPVHVFVIYLLNTSLSAIRSLNDLVITTWPRLVNDRAPVGGVFTVNGFCSLIFLWFLWFFVAFGG